MMSFVQDHLQKVAIAEIGLLNKVPEPAFDRVTRLVTHKLGVPVSLLSVIDDARERQFFKSLVGLQEPWASRQETPMTHSFCQYVVATGDALVIADARTDDMLSCNSAIEELGVVAYLGAPVFDPRGEAIAAICAIDGEPREWTVKEVEFMTVLGRLVSDTIALQAAIVAGNMLLEQISDAA